MGFQEYSLTGSNGSEIIFSLKTALSGAGPWTVLSSSDGTTYSTTGDILTHVGSGAGGLRNASAWFRITDGDQGREYLFQRIDNETWSMRLSPAAGFTQDPILGPVDAVNAPIATDQNALDWQTMFTSTAMNQRIGVEDQAPWRWFMSASWQSNPAISSWMVADAVRTGSAAAFTLNVFDGFSYELASFSPTLFETRLAFLTQSVESSGGGGAPADVTAPVVAFSPAGGGIRKRSTITVDVTDDEGQLAFVAIHAFPDRGDTVAVLSGSASSYTFGTQLDAGSSRSAIANGSRFQITHDAPGWNASSFRLAVAAVDDSGNTVTTSSVFFVSDALPERTYDASRLRKTYGSARSLPRLVAR